MTTDLSGSLVRSAVGRYVYIIIYIYMSGLTHCALHAAELNPRQMRPRIMLSAMTLQRGAIGRHCYSIWYVRITVRRMIFTSVVSRSFAPCHPWGERRRKRKRSTIFPERTRKGHRQSRPTLELFLGQHWGNSWETGVERIIMGLPERIDTVLNWTEVNWSEVNWTCSVSFQKKSWPRSCWAFKTMLYV